MTRWTGRPWSGINHRATSGHLVSPPSFSGSYNPGRTDRMRLFPKLSASDFDEKPISRDIAEILADFAGIIITRQVR